MRSTFIGVTFIVAAIAAGYVLHTGRIVIPNEWNPWAPLAIEDPLNALTRFKLTRAAADGAVCFSILEQSALRYERLSDRETGSGCGYRNAVRIAGTRVQVGEPFTLTCRSALALALWEHHVLLPAALRHFDQPLERIEHLGSYACRNIYGRKDAPLSRHAGADALDISGFVLRNGRYVRVQRDWGSEDDDGRFLREVHAGACRVFDSVLGPEYNAAHRDHFHLDRGGYRICR